MFSGALFGGGLLGGAKPPTSCVCDIASDESVESVVARGVRRVLSDATDDAGELERLHTP